MPIHMPAETLGWLQSCKCSTHSPVPATVLDPFGGAGTVGNVAVMGVNRIGKNEQPCENSHLATGFDYDWLRFKRYLGPHFPSIVDIQCGEKAILL